jgi:hypothetical protein
VLQQLREERGRLQLKVTPPHSPVRSSPLLRYLFVTRDRQLNILDIVRVTNKDALKRIAHLESSLAGECNLFLCHPFGRSHCVEQRTSCLSPRCSSRSSAPPAICTDPHE